ncbi:ABC transporter substrate-binding protein [Iodobacter sp.]|uniref:substrate-binding periplasmic protein n=1 Tax=Iodobacter sp. TaxID=1915058 RepID=UPI0025F2B550|nr:transporter substrate-binding domain-containing protein [Iodobacter sp.]
MKLQLCKVLVVALFAVYLAPSSAAGQAENIVLCHEEEDSYPWVLKGRPGLDIILLKMIAKKLKVKFEMRPLPWVRCLHELKNNHVSGAFNLSFGAERLDIGHYPMLGNKPNIDQRLHSDSYSLYRLKGSGINWDGERLLNPYGGIVGAQSGFAVIPQLKELGTKVDDQTRSAEINFKKLMVGRVGAVALPTKEGDMQLRNKRFFSKRIEKIGPPLVDKNYYLVISNDFYTRNPKLAKQIWVTLANMRESAEFKKMVAQFN